MINSMKEAISRLLLCSFSVLLALWSLVFLVFSGTAQAASTNQEAQKTRIYLSIA